MKSADSARLRKIKGFYISIFLAILSYSISAFAYDNGDWQYWNTASVETSLNKHVKIKVAEEERFGGNWSELYYIHTEGFIMCKILDWFSVNTNFRWILQKQNKEWKNEYQPNIEGTFKADLWNFTVEDRNRIEYRIREDADDGWRYRNKASLVFPALWKKIDLRPYVSDEVFADFIAGKLNKNRFYLGVRAKLMKHLKAEIYYMWQASLSKGDWTNDNVFGTKVRLDF